MTTGPIRYCPSCGLKHTHHYDTACNGCGGPIGPPPDRTGRSRTGGGRRRGDMGSKQKRATRAAVIKRHGMTCWLCGRAIDPTAIGDGAFSLDHVVPLSKGGGNAIANLRPAHRYCNNERADDRAPGGLAA